MVLAIFTEFSFFPFCAHSLSSLSLVPFTMASNDNWISAFGSVSGELAHSSDGTRGLSTTPSDILLDCFRV
jgi:hypothetical protein